MPTLVVLIATNYRGKQQALALGYLGAAQASAFVLAFLLVGVLSTFASWRLAFALLVPLAAVVVALSFRLKPVERHAGLVIDWIGAALAALAMILISLGFNFLNAWGLLLATPERHSTCWDCRRRPS